MKVSLNWLGKLVELPPTVPALMDLPTMAGVDVEGIESRRANFANLPGMNPLRRCTEMITVFRRGS